MKKTLNKFLKFLGFNVVKAKRPRARKITPEKLDALNASARLRNEKNKKIMATYHEGQKPYTEAELLNSGKTHYVGDGCVPPHPEFETRCVKQPSSDNNVTGPTS